MQKWIFIFFLLATMSCSQQEEILLGKWVVHSRFYQASYQILEEEKEFKALVLYYNDGTSKYQYDGSNKHFLFTKLKKKKGQYIDAISGATTKEGRGEHLSIHPKNKDTLEVTTYIMDRPLKEIWTRKFTK